MYLANTTGGVHGLLFMLILLAMLRRKLAMCLYLVHLAYPKLDFGHLEFWYFPELGFLGTFNMFLRTVF